MTPTRTSYTRESTDNSTRSSISYHTALQKQQSVLPLLTISTPTQWKDSLKQLSDEQLKDLLLVDTNDTDTDNDNDPVQRFYDEIKMTASRIKQYRMFEKEIITREEESEDHDADADVQLVVSSPASLTRHCHNTDNNDDHGNSNHKRRSSSEFSFYRYTASKSIEGQQQQQQQQQQYDRDNHDDELIRLCVRILDLTRPTKTKTTTTKAAIVVDVSKIRLRLVPSRMKEHIFWESLFVLLYQRVKQHTQNALYKRIENSVNDEVRGLPTMNNTSANTSNTITTHTNQEEVIKEKIKTSRHFVSQLIVQNDILREEKEQLEQYVYKLWTVHTTKKKESPQQPQHQHRQTTKKEIKKQEEDEDGNEEEKEKETTNRQKKNQHQKQNDTNNDRCINCGFENDNGSTKDNNTRPSAVAASPPEREQQQPQPQNNKKQHKGTWIVSKETLEFLQYPQEAKQALRVEKQKRLTRVQEEMKFIIDSDDHLQDTHGYWDCCQQQDDSTGTMKTNNYYDTPCTCD